MDQGKVFINETGKFLQFSKGDSLNTNFKKIWLYSWVDSIHCATVADKIPRNVQWKGNNPAHDVVISVPVSVVTTRTVTIIKIEDME